MPSLIPGYEYDIFISYRQKDNKGDRWVTQFVADLRTELESTFKDDISIYFDENPHDGLHENHDVEDSLREKLKVIVLIPIVSRTYCDPRAYAWTHELKPFVAHALSDRYGLKVKLPNGNVAGRILPIRIHDISKEDSRLFEAEIQSVLRPIDFVFRSAGVNRPLLATDKKEQNADHTLYRDQVNKVANAISDIITVMQSPPSLEAVRGSESRSLISVDPGPAKKKWIAIASIFALIAAIITYLFFLPKGRTLRAPEDSGVAVLPFRNNTGSPDLDFYGQGIASEVRTQLSMSKHFRLVSSLQATIPYGTSTKPPHEIGSELGVDFLLTGLYQKAGNKIRVQAEMINTADGAVVWSFPYESELNDVFKIQADIAERVLKRFARKMDDPIRAVSTSNLEAYAHYNRGYRLYIEADQSLGYVKAHQPAIDELKTAIAIDSQFVEAWVQLINVEGYIALNMPMDTVREQRIAQYLNDFHLRFPEAWQGDLVDGIYAYRVTHRYYEALAALSRVLEKDPQNLEAILTTSYIKKRSLEYAESLRLKRVALKLNPSNGSDWRDVAETLTQMGDVKNAMKAYVNAWQLNGTRDIAIGAIDLALENGFSLDGLPADLKRKAGYALDARIAGFGSDWEKCAKASVKDKDTLGTAMAYFELGSRDSAVYWANLGFPNANLYQRIVFSAALGHREEAFKLKNKLFDKLTSTGDDKLSQISSRLYEILLHSLFGEYRQATDKLSELNRDYPEWGDYGLFHDPWFSKIRKEYPPFQEALKNIRRQPLPDVSELMTF